MAIADTVRGRLSRFNRPRIRRRRRRRLSPLRLIAILRWAMLLGIVAAAVWAVLLEMRTSHLEARVFTRLDRGMGFALAPGASESIRFPQAGPYDERLGYAELPGFIASLTAHRFAVVSQAMWSPGMRRFVGAGGFPIYSEKARAGLEVFDRNDDRVYAARFPQSAYRDFAEIPPLLVNSLLFIEDRYLLDANDPERNAAVEWKRFLKAAAGRIAGSLKPGLRAGGGSTLATQIEKLRHSPAGRTEGVGEKLRQMMTASARIYMDGANTLERRKEVLATYLNATPLSSQPGYGEVIGIGDALWAWYGTDFAEANRVLAATPRNAAELKRQGEIYRQVLSLLLAGRRPSYYLVAHRPALAALTDRYLRLMGEAAVIDPALRDAALGARAPFLAAPPLPQPVAVDKATEDTRARLVGLLKLADFYQLDRLDLSVATSIDTAAQARVSAVLQRLSDPAYLRSLGMIGHNLLGSGDPAKVNYSFVLYERGADRNYLRVKADSLNAPFDIGSGAKLMLGSTAKLRTLATYLDIVVTLHRRLAPLSRKELLATAAAGRDPLTEWAAKHLANSGDRTLQPMLDAAMARQYSASPGSFFTGGGVQSFGNFEHWEDYDRPSVEQAFENSINLAFVRLLRDIVHYYTVDEGVETESLLSDPDNPERTRYLERFADKEGRQYLDRFYKDYHGLSPDEALSLMVRRTRPLPKHIAAVYLAFHPEARFAAFSDFLAAHLRYHGLSEDELWDLYRDCAPGRLSRADQAYLAGVNPLALWLVGYLKDHPQATRAEVMEASAAVRQEAYGWLFKGSLYKQNKRIRTLLDEDAFDHILEHWRSLGYPFAHLVPSLGTAIGASCDRPDALAELIGIIQNDGRRVASADIERLRFAAGTPYETDLAVAPRSEQVMVPEVARTLRRALLGVVAHGTGVRLHGAYAKADGTPLAVGGKTGTGDNRFDRFSAGGGIVSSRVVDRTATFVFFLGDRYFGTVTAYVAGSEAARYHFISALAVQLLKALEPQLKPLIDAPPPAPAKPATLVSASG